MTPIKTAALNLAAICLFCLSSFALDPETEKIMPFVSSKSACLKCHNGTALTGSINNTGAACDTLCLECHRDMDRHHGVGMRPFNRPGANLRLTHNKKIACITCHDLNFHRFDSAPWRSESLFEKIFSRKERYKTYYLIINNSNGQLCKKCH